MNVFDEPASLQINAARAEFLRRSLQSLEPLDIVTAADIGCGVGHFSGVLEQAGMRVTAVDGRDENVSEAQRRVPGVATAVLDVESPTLAELGKFDFVLCYGLLYHLENPFAAVRNLGSITEKALLIESVCAPGRSPLAVLYDEDHDVDQGLRYYAMIPTETWLVKALYISGFEHVYRTRVPPAHRDFTPSLSKRKRRTVLLATRAPVIEPTWCAAEEPTTRKYIWDRLGPALESEGLRARVRSGLRGTGRRQ